MLQKKLGNGTVIVNLYGPTEITAVATAYVIDHEIPKELSTVYIGTPLPNYELYIVNEHNQLCPENVTGELLISSVGVGKGYLNQPEKTKEVFILDPIQPHSGKKFYRSGDRVRLLSNGQVEYRGRRDAQVKIRGFRIEIGEIEDNFGKHEGIKDVAVIVKSDEAGTKMLAAFYSSINGQPIPSTELVQFLSKKVPSYMVPQYIGHLDQMPLSPTGKIDRKQLATLELTAGADDANYTAPVNETQAEIASAWEKAFGRTKISIHDDFFELGGYSLKILEILVMLKPRFPSLKINDFFLHPTIEQLSARVAQSGAASQDDQWEQMNFPIQDLQEYPLAFVGDEAVLTAPYKQEHILLTGATGYLGSHLLNELLRQSQAVIYCLVRPSGSTGPRERLVEIMSDYFGPSIVKAMENRVVAVQGDLERDNLGLNEADARLVMERIDSIIHCGADVRHFGESEHFAKVNVESTSRLLDLAKRNRHVRFHFISTIGIPEDLAMNGQWKGITAGSGYDTSYVENVYTNSKLEAEKLVVKAGEQEGVAATVYRVGNLSCHSKNGKFQKNIDHNAFYRMLKAMLILKRAPRVRWEVDMTPINYAGQSIAALALQQETVGRIFHICNPNTISYEQMIGYFQSYGYEIELLDWREYEAWLLNPAIEKNQEGLELAMAQLEGDGAKNSMYRYGCAQTVQYLEKSGVTCAEADEQFFNKLIQYAEEIGYFTRPELVGSR